MPWRRDPGKDVAWRQPQRQPVRVTENDRVAGCQAERFGNRSRSRDRTRDVGHLHPRISRVTRLTDIYHLAVPAGDDRAEWTDPQEKTRSDDLE
jgi:hypothetical protein